MATFGRALTKGGQAGALIGTVVGVGVAWVAVLSSDGFAVLGALFYSGVIGAFLGVIAGTLGGALLGLILGIVLNLLLGPAATVPRRPEQIPISRTVGCAVGLFPLIALLAVSQSAVNEWWPVPVVVSLFAVLAIYMQVPKIIGPTSLPSSTKR